MDHSYTDLQMAGVRGAWQVRQMAVPPPAAAEEVIGAGMGAEETAVTGEGSTTVAEDDEDAMEVTANPPSLSTEQCEKVQN